MAKAPDPNSLNQKLYQSIKENFSSQSFRTAKDRNAHKKSFVETSKLEVGDSHYSKVFKRYLKDEKLNPVDYGLAPFKESRNKSSATGLSANIKDGSIEMKPDVQIISPETLQKQADENTGSVKDAEDGKFQMKFDNKMVGSFFSGFYMILQFAVPQLEDLTKDEKEMLGDAWLPIFQQYLSTGFFRFVAPMMVTLTVFGKKIKTAREIKKKEIEQEVKNNKRIIDARKEEIVKEHAAKTD